MYYYSVEILNEDRVVAVAIDDEFINSSPKYSSEEEVVYDYVCSNLDELTLDSPSGIVVEEIDKDEYYDYRPFDRF